MDPGWKIIGKALIAFVVYCVVVLGVGTMLDIVR